MSIMNIKELSNLIKSSLPRENILLLAEIQGLKFSNGHLYIQLKDTNGCINANIWSSNVTSDIRELKTGDKITVKGKLNYWDKQGSLKFTINKLLNVKGEGELHKKYKQIEKKYREKGYFLDENKLSLPKMIKNILILTSKNGAALQDFYKCIENANAFINHKLEDVIVQGVNCPSNICKILTKLINEDSNDYDLIVITRGGGSFEDLFGFCQPELIECVHKLKIPVLSAIGHEVDKPLLDLVADKVASTPSLAAQFIVNHNRKYVEYLQYKKNNILLLLQKALNKKVNKLDQYKHNINNNKHELVLYLENLKRQLRETIMDEIHNKLIYLEKESSKYKLTDDIILLSEGIKMKTNKELLNKYNNKEPITIQWNNVVVTFSGYSI